MDLWTQYRVRFDFLTSLCSSTPADPDIVAAWLKARMPRVKPAGAASIEEINEEVLASIERGEGEPDETVNFMVFQRHDGVLVMRAGTVRAHIKDCARVLSAQFIGKIQGERAFSTRVINGVYPDKQTHWIPIERNGKPLQAADDSRDKPIHVKGPRGEPLNAIKRFEFVETPVSLSFTINVLGRSVSETDLRHIFEYGGTHGYGGERGDGEGKYDYTLDRITRDAEAEEERATVAHGRSAGRKA